MTVAKGITKPMTREDVTDLIYSAKVQKGERINSRTTG